MNDTDSKQNRERYLRELGVRKYVERGRSPIFVTGEEKHGLAPMKLVEACLGLDTLASYFAKGLELLDSLDSGKFEKILEEFPAYWMSDLAKEFAFSLLIETLNQLNHLRK